MAKAFNLTAQINLQGPANIKPVVAKIKRELGSVSTNVDIKFDSKAAKNVSLLSKNLRNLNTVLAQTSTNARTLTAALGGLNSQLKDLTSVGKINSSLEKTSQKITSTAKATAQAATQMEEFGKQSALAIRRFAAFSVVTTGVFGLINAISSATKAFIEFDRQIIRLRQVTGAGAVEIESLRKAIRTLAQDLGVSSEQLSRVAVTLAQAGFSAKETEQALGALAKTDLAATFDNIEDTTEGAIAAMRQFGLEANQLEQALGGINAVAASFAVESSDIVAAISRAGGAFAASSKGVSEGIDALNEFVAVFTSVRATTRESAETIATGLRTIFTRIQRGSTIDFLREFGVELQDAEGKFVGPYEAVRRLSEVLQTLDPRDVRFSQIVEELGGFRQIGKVIPLIQQFSTAQEALKVAQQGGGSLADAQAKAQLSLANQIARVREEFLALVDAVGQSQTFQVLFKTVLGLTSGLIKLAGVLKPILPLLTILGAVKAVGAAKQFSSGFFGGLSKSGGSASVGTSGADAAKEEAKGAALSQAAEATSSNTEALNTLTSAINNLNNTINSRGGATGLNQGGKVLAFARGGTVPGTGNRDTVPAMLQPGEFVIRKKAVEAIGANNLHRMNKFAGGGKARASMVQDVEYLKTYDGDSLTVSYTPKAEPFNTSSRLVGYDAYELKSGTKEERKLGQKAKEITESWASNQSSKALLEKFEAASGKKDKYGRPMFDAPRLGQRLVKAGVAVPYGGSGEKATKDNDQQLSFGGLVQAFQGGGTVEEIARNEKLSLEEAILKEVQAYGGIRGVKSKLGIKPGNRTLDSLLRAGNIRAGKGIAEATDVINELLQNETIQRDLTDKTIAESIKVGVVGLQPLDYQEIRGPLELGGKSVTMHIAGLSSQFAEAVAKMRQQLSSVVKDFAGSIQEKAIFGGKKNLRFDFDETLVSGADIYDENGQIDIAAYSDLERVKEGLDKGVLTQLGQKLKQLIELDPSILDRISILTARPQESADLLSKKLQQLGIPISSSKITGVSGGNKANSMSELDKLIDDNIQNIQNVRKSGKEAVQYQPVEDLTDVQSQATGLYNTEGPIMEATLTALGARGGTIQNQAVDYAAGLGPAAQYFPGIGDTWPTEVKRTLDSTALKRAEEEFARYFKEGGLEKYAVGGSVSDTVPALLTPGEFVINKKAASRIGSAKLNKLNKADKIQGFNKGGAVGSIVQRFAGGGEAIANEQLEYLARQAERAGKSLNAFSVDIKNEIADLARNITKNFNDKQQNIADVIIRSRGKAEASDIINEDDLFLEVKRDIQEAIHEFDPSISMDELETAAERIVVNLAHGLSLEEITNKVTILGNAMDKTITNQEALDKATEMVTERLGVLSDEMKLTVEELEAIDYKKSGQAQADFGFLGNINPAAALNFRNSSMGSTLLSGAKSFQDDLGLGRIIPGIGRFGEALRGLPGPIGNAVKAIGGLSGAVAAMASIIGSEVIPKIAEGLDMGDSVALAAAGQGLAQGGSMAVSLGTLGNQIAGPIGGLIGTIGGAVSGLILGISEGIQTKRLENSINKLGENIEAVNKAFKELADYDSAENLQKAQAANDALTDNIKDLGAQAERTYGEAAMDAGGWAAAGATAGTVIGGVIGTVVPGLGTAIGAAIGAGIGTVAGGLYGAFKGPSELDDEALMNQLEAINSYIDGLNKLAERRISLKSLDDIDAFLSGAADAFDKIQQELDAGQITEDQAKERRANVERGIGRQSTVVEEAQIGALSRAGYNVDANRPLSEQLPGMGDEAQQIAETASQTAAYAAAMAELKRNFGDNEKAIRRESKDKEKLIARGYQLIGQQERQSYLTARLAIATKEVVKETEDLLQMYNMVLGGIKRFRDELGELDRTAQFEIGVLTGRGRMMEPSRADENVLRNTEGYTQQEVEAVASRVTTLAGGGEQAQLLGERITASKIVEDRLGDILRNADKNDIGQVETELEGLFNAAGISADATGPILEEVRRVLETETGQRQGKSLQELTREFPALQEAMKSMQKAQEVGIAILEAYNEAVVESNRVLNQYAEAMLQSRQYLVRADRIAADAALDLAKALGRNLSLDTLNAPFEQEIRSMTRGLVGGNGSTDPIEIADAIRRGQAQASDLARQREEAIAGGDTDKAAELSAAQADLITNTTEAYQALEKLANDGSAAANALSKIQERRNRLNAGADILQTIFTQTGEEALKMQQGFAAFRLAMSGELDFDNQQQRALAFQGMNNVLPLLSAEQQGRVRGNMLEQMFRARYGENADLSQIEVVPAQGGEEAITVQDIIDGQRDPAADAQTAHLIEAYNQAVERQVKANEELSKLRAEEAGKLLDINTKIYELLKERLQNIVDDAKEQQDQRKQDAKDRAAEQQARADANRVPADGPALPPVKLEDLRQPAATPRARDNQAQAQAREAEIRRSRTSARRRGEEIVTSGGTASSGRARSNAEAAARREEERRRKREAEGRQPSRNPRDIARSARQKKDEEAATQSGQPNASRQPEPAPIELPAGGLPVDLDLSALDAMASNAMTPGSIYTHDTHLEKILSEMNAQNQAMSLGGVLDSLSNLSSPNLPQQQELSSSNNKVLEQFANILPEVNAELLNFTRKLGTGISSLLKQLSGGETAADGESNLQTSVSIFERNVTNFGAFTKEFGTYVDKLANINLPDTIKLSGNYTLDVRVSGAAAFQSIEEKTKELIDKKISEGMDDLIVKLAKQTNYAVDLRRRGS